MTPQKRKQANVKHLLNNPVKSDQPPLKFRKEETWDWLAYIGYILVVVVPLIKICVNIIAYVNRKEITIAVPFYDKGLPLIFLLGFLLTLGVMQKSSYQLPKIINKFYVGILGISFILFGFYITDPDMLWLPGALILGATLGVLAMWYIHYFYKKSKDGYHLVWLKVLLFSFIPILPLFFYTKVAVYHFHEPIGMAFGHYIKDPSQKGNKKITFLRR